MHFYEQDMYKNTIVYYLLKNKILILCGQIQERIPTPATTRKDLHYDSNITLQNRKMYHIMIQNITSFFFISDRRGGNNKQTIIMIRNDIGPCPKTVLLILYATIIKYVTRFQIGSSHYYPNFISLYHHPHYVPRLFYCNPVTREIFRFFARPSDSYPGIICAIREKNSNAQSLQRLKMKKILYNFIG